MAKPDKVKRKRHNVRRVLDRTRSQHKIVLSEALNEIHIYKQTLGVIGLGSF